MRRIVLSLLLGLAVVTSTRAQFPVQNVPTPMGRPYVVEADPVADEGYYVGPLWTVDLEYLLWFMKPHSFASPVVGTTTDPDATLGGFVSTVGAGHPRYVNNVGPGSVDRGPFSGGRISFTRALPVSFDRCVYLEIAALWLPRQEQTRIFTSSPAGNPNILLPFQTTATTPLGPPGNYSLVLAGNIGPDLLPIRYGGVAEVSTSTELWGGEANIGGPFYRSDSFGFEGLIGFRYMGLKDMVAISTTTEIAPGLGTLDKFSTTSQFFGGQLGLRFLWSDDRWAALVQSKVGMGTCQSSLGVRGESSLPAGFPGPQLPGGFYTSSTNIGNTDRSLFSTIVDLNASLRFALTQAIGVSVGYNFLYWDGVFRAAEQVSNTINPTYNPVLSGVVGGTQTGTPQPMRQQNPSDVWAHGLNFVLDLRF